MRSRSDVRRASRRTIPAVLLAALTLSGAVACGGGGGGTDGGTAKASPTAVTTTGAVTTLLDKGLQQLADGDADAAQGTLQSVLTLDPKNLYALYNLGLIAQQAGDEDSARSYYAKALAVNDSYVPALFNDAILTETTDLPLAVAAYRKVITLNPKMAAAYVRLGYALIHQGDTAEGRRYLQRGFALDPSLTKAPAPTYS